MSGPGGTPLVIYHTSDVHDRRGFGRELARVVEPGALLVDCGDALRGSSTLYLRDEPVMREFGLAPYRAQAVGNREFHYLHRLMLARSRRMPIPWVCTNLIDLRARTPAFERTLIVDAGAYRVRLLGLLVPQYPVGSPWEKIFGWRFLAPDAALDGIMAEPGDFDATIVLSHLGLDADRALARRHEGVSVIAGGHSHDTLAAPEIVRGVPIVHAGAYAKHAGRLEVSLDARGAATVISYRLIPLQCVEVGTAR
ncbi:MAG TPA: metallophosphoesterase [Candidatus Eremiobacteraceae bacterium]|nr:metallophosphoesterase [Candidatus Eremiobacteraceae bacterium]